MAKTYAWSVFHTEFNEYNQPTKSVMPGDEVTADKIGVDKETFEDLVERGVVREQPYPEDLPDDLSPNEYFRQQDAKMVAGELDEDEADEVKERQEAEFKASYTAYDAEEAPAPKAAPAQTSANK